VSKKLGLLGGISWISTVDYLTYINKIVGERLGGLNNAPCVIHCVNMADIEILMKAKNYDAVLELFINVCQSMKRDGAEGLVICANTMHMFAEQIERATGLPVIHLVKATAEAIRKENISTIGLLGTRPTMDMDFYVNILKDRGIKTLVPGEEQKDLIHDSIFRELSRGIFTGETRDQYLSIIGDLVKKGAQGIVLGCTDIPPLLRDNKLPVPLFDTTRIHAEAAAEFCLGIK
jgi:aspartate racemase